MLNLFRRRPDIGGEVARLENYAVAADVRDAFRRFLETADDAELFHINPRYLAERLGQSERATLKLLLAALYEGIVTVHWDVQCPFCGGVEEGVCSLSELRHDTDCKMCGAHFSPHLDHEVYVTFSIHHRLRPASPGSDNTSFRAQVDERLGRTPGFAMLTLPDFQRLFPQQRLLPNESLDVMRVVLVFTDLAGSTALYARRGDPRAYYLVHLHFDALFQVADSHGGMVVKTIGDAILAVFQTPAEAFEAARAMQQAIARLNERYNLEDHECLILKVGMHSGPSLSVTLNGNPDYFGTTVNIASRVEKFSAGGDIVLTDAIYADPTVQELLGGKVEESRLVVLKGIEEQVQIYRVVVEQGAEVSTPVS